MTNEVLTPEFLEEVRASLKPGFDPARMEELTQEPAIHEYRDALLYLQVDVEDQLKRRAADMDRLNADNPRPQAGVAMELDNLERWRDKALGFRRHVHLRILEVNAILRQVNRGRDFSIAELAARVQVLENAIRAHRDGILEWDEHEGGTEEDLVLWRVL